MTKEKTITNPLCPNPRSWWLLRVAVLTLVLMLVSSLIGKHPVAAQSPQSPAGDQYEATQPDASAPASATPSDSETGPVSGDGATPSPTETTSPTSEDAGSAAPTDSGHPGWFPSFPEFFGGDPGVDPPAPSGPEAPADEPSILPGWFPSLPPIFGCDPQRCDPPPPTDPEVAADDPSILPGWFPSLPEFFGGDPGVDPPAPDPEAAASAPSTDLAAGENAGGDIASKESASTEDEPEEMKSVQCNATSTQNPTAGPPGTASRVSASCGGGSASGGGSGSPTGPSSYGGSGTPDTPYYGGYETSPDYGPHENPDDYPTDYGGYETPSDGGYDSSSDGGWSETDSIPIVDPPEPPVSEPQRNSGDETSSGGEGIPDTPYYGGYETSPDGGDTPSPPEPDPPSPQGSGPIFPPTGNVQGGPQEPGEPAPDKEPADPQAECPEGEKYVEGQGCTPETRGEGDICSEANAARVNGQGSAGAIEKCPVKPPVNPDCVFNRLLCPWAKEPPPGGEIKADNRTPEEQERARKLAEECMALKELYPNVSDCGFARLLMQLEGYKFVEDTDSKKPIKTPDPDNPNGLKTISTLEDFVDDLWRSIFDPPGVEPRPRGNTPVDGRPAPPRPPEPTLTPNGQQRPTVGNKPIIRRPPLSGPGRPVRGSK